MSSEKIHTRLYVPYPLSSQTVVPISEDQSHLIRNVLRLESGDTVSVFNGRDGEWSGSLNFQGKKQANVRMVQQTRLQETLSPLKLLFAPIKKHRMDFIIEKATELGVTELLPIITERTQSERVKTERLIAQSIEAAEQCERLSVPIIHEPQKLTRLLESWPQNKVLFVCAEAGESVPLYPALENISEEDASFLVGPEGGFSPDELKFLKQQPFVRPVHLGPRILRADTAALAVLSCWQSLKGDWRYHKPANRE